ncbi:hypothetical protein MHY29_03350 [Micrococcus sp. ACRRV]|uniref:hypothetical protein n=1 Tax=Micrococcus sp. ACRRV TaxID=2918203 RepID=UPI001EF1FE55|nr:hypothetical protein [Micrococcus sp. ACRRV]MCG7421882.1 hypothetical protein [Micrococcus sp. ACRRV]
MRSDDVAPASARPSGLDDPAVRGPIRRYQAMTAGTGLVSAAAVAGVLGLQSDPGYAREVLQSRTWGQYEVSAQQVQDFLTPPGGAVLGAVGVLLTAALLVWAAQRLWGATRWLGTALAGVGLLSAVFWAVDGGRMAARGASGMAVLVAVGAMAVFCAVWLVTAHSKAVREAFLG